MGDEGGVEDWEDEAPFFHHMEELVLLLSVRPLSPGERKIWVWPANLLHYVMDFHRHMWEHKRLLRGMVYCMCFILQFVAHRSGVLGVTFSTVTIQIHKMMQTGLQISENKNAYLGKLWKIMSILSRCSFTHPAMAPLPLVKFVRSYMLHLHQCRPRTVPWHSEEKTLLWDFVCCGNAMTKSTIP